MALHADKSSKSADAFGTPSGYGGRQAPNLPGARENWGMMGGRKKLVVATAVAAYAMTVVARPLDAPALNHVHPAYSSDHKIVPAPVMGIRGEVRILKIADAG